MAYVIKESAKAPETPLAFKPDFFEESFGEQKCLIVDVGGSKKESITVNTGGSAYQLNFSPDGSRLALSVATSASVDDSYMQQQVKVADTKTGNIIATIENEGKLGGITWSPDGTRLALNAALNLNDPTNGSILIVSSNGGKPTVIDAQFKGKYEQLQWTAANTIHYLASESTASTIGTITPDGKVRQVLFNTGVHHITGFDRSTSGTIAFFANSPEHSTELFTLANKKGATPVRRTQSNEWLKEVKLGKQEVIKYKPATANMRLRACLFIRSTTRPVREYHSLQWFTADPNRTMATGGSPATRCPDKWLPLKDMLCFFPTTGAVPVAEQSLLIAVRAMRREKNLMTS